MNKILLSIGFLFINTLLIHSQEIKSNELTELSYKLIPQYELPKKYIIDGYSTLYPKEHRFRRADIVFFLSIPITLFLMQNLLNLFNNLNVFLDNYNSDLGRDNFGYTAGEWNFLLSSITLIPLGVMIYDQIYIRDYPLIPTFKQETFHETRLNFTLYRTSF